jgi:hypothetical protein
MVQIEISMSLEEMTLRIVQNMRKRNSGWIYFRDILEAASIHNTSADIVTKSIEEKFGEKIRIIGN